jgi:hypothetical protein
VAIAGCDDSEDGVTFTAGTSSSGTGGKSTAGSANAGNGGKASAGSNSTAGSSGAQATGGENEGGSSVSGGAPGVDAGAPAVEGGASPVAGASGTDAGAGGEAGDDTGPHQTPRLEYGFDENSGTSISDSSGRGLDATLTQAAWASQGRSGSALALSGGILPAQYASVPAGVFAGAKATTIAAWVKLAANPIWARVFDVGNAAAGLDTRFMYLALDSNLNGKTGVRFSYFGGSPENEAVVTTGTVLPLDVWKHLAVTMAENGEQAIVIDGFPAAKSSTVAIPPSELEPLSAVSYLGKSRFDGDAGFQGAMDDFVVYDRVLSSTELGVLAAPKSDYTRLAFDEGAGSTSEDASDRAADATLSSGATWSSGRLGAAVQVSGVEQYVTLDNPIAGCTTELSISMWVKHVAAANWARIFDFGGITNNFMFLTPSTHEGKLFFTLKSAARETAITSDTTIPPDSAWHHLAVVVNATVATVYIDGEVAGSVATPVTPTELGATNEHWLGKSRFSGANGTDPYFNGAFDEVRISCRAFTVDEVRNLAFK